MYLNINFNHDCKFGQIHTYKKPAWFFQWIFLFPPIGPLCPPHSGPTSMGNPSLGFSSIFKVIGTACYRRLSNSICEWYCNLLLNSIHSLLIEIFMMNIILLSFNWWIIQKFSAQYCLAKDMKHTLLYAVALNMAVQRHLGAFLKTLLFLSYWVTIQIFWVQKFYIISCLASVFWFIVGEGANYPGQSLH